MVVTDEDAAFRDPFEARISAFFRPVAAILRHASLVILLNVYLFAAKVG